MKFGGPKALQAMGLYDAAQSHLVRVDFEACSASPAVKTAAPSRTISFIRNPPISEPRANAPGVVKRNERVVRKTTMPARLPIADALGEKRRSAMRTPAVTSKSPKKFDTPRTLRI